MAITKSYYGRLLLLSICIFCTFSSFTSYSQNLPPAKTTFTKYEFWNKKGEQLLGEKLSEGLSNSSIEISLMKSEHGDFYDSYIEGYIQFFNGKFIEKVLSVRKFVNQGGTTGYIANTINGYNRKSTWLLDYTGTKLISISLMVENDSVFKISN